MLGGFFRNMVFHKNGKPRSITRKILFKDDTYPRNIFYYVIFNKMGNLRPSFKMWTAIYHSDFHRNEIELVRTDMKGKDAELECFLPYRPPPKIDPIVKIIAFYLPQFHPFPENDEWWGKGFTEWTNVGKAVPNYEGHYQPHCPIHFGYYDLRIPSVMEDQARVAREYGIYGFSYYFYWFSGKILMREPLEAMLGNPNVDIPFCLTWANENWSRRWDGKDNELLISQNHSAEDSIELIRYVSKYFEDPRYIRVDCKPVFIVYRADLIPNMAETIAAWREEARKLGFAGLYVIAAETDRAVDPSAFGFDAGVEFPPHRLDNNSIVDSLKITNKDFAGKIFSYNAAANTYVTRPEPEYKVFRTAMLSWDNTARKQNAPYIYHGFSISAFREWLSALCHRVAKNPRYGPDEKLVFVNAWNEWAEGSHLEPDRRYGFSYLQSIHDVVTPFDQNCFQSSDFPKEKTYEGALIVHVEDASSWRNSRSLLENYSKMDMYITTCESTIFHEIKIDFPNAFIDIVENRGKDIRPFVYILKKIFPLKYKFACKILISDICGDEYQQKLLDLLNIISLNEIEEIFKNDDKCGLLVHNYLKRKISSDNRSAISTTYPLLSEIGSLLSPGQWNPHTCFWFRPDALKLLDRIDPDFRWYIEKAVGGRGKAQDIENILTGVVESAGFHIRELNS